MANNKWVEATIMVSGSVRVVSFSYLQIGTIILHSDVHGTIYISIPNGNITEEIINSVCEDASFIVLCLEHKITKSIKLKFRKIQHN